MVSIFVRYKERFACSSLGILSEEKRNSVERGGKIIMPPSVLAKLSNLDIVYPLLFKLTNARTKKVTHTGVLEFVAEEKKIYLPSWLMKNLEVKEGETITVENTTLPVAKYSRFQPLSASFLDITNPKAVLENYLRQFACLTTGDVLSIDYNDKIYELKVLETRPSFAVNIIECDMSVDFEAPEGYGDESPQSKDETGSDNSDEFVPFAGAGSRLDGKAKKRKSDEEKRSEVKNKKQKRARGVPDYGYEIGSVDFMRDCPPPPKVEEAHEFKPFTGEGCSMLTASGSSNSDTE